MTPRRMTQRKDDPKKHVPKKYDRLKHAEPLLEIQKCCNQVVCRQQSAARMRRQSRKPMKNSAT
eukprot:2121138-Amphidinium_carterae.1